MDPMFLSRRRLMLGAGAVSALAAMPAWAQGHSLHRGRKHGGAPIRAGFDEVSGEVIDLVVGEGPRVVQGRKSHGIAVNGSVPGPLIRLKQGQNVRLNVTNTLHEDTSIHWHGLLLPFHMDGVPGISFPGIKPGQTFAYEFPIRQAGTDWCHAFGPAGAAGPLRPADDRARRARAGGI